MTDIPGWCAFMLMTLNAILGIGGGMFIIVEAARDHLWDGIPFGLAGVGLGSLCAYGSFQVWPWLS